MDDLTSEQLMEKHPDATSFGHARELERVAQAQAERDDDEVIRKRERDAEIARHPHTLLRGILSDLSSPAARASDITTKHAMLHAAVVRLANVILAHTPAPDAETTADPVWPHEPERTTNEEFRRPQQPVEGADEQEPAR